MQHVTHQIAGCNSYAKLSLLQSLLILFFKSIRELCGGRNSLSKEKKKCQEERIYLFLCGALVFAHNFLGREYSAAGSSAKNCELHQFLSLNLKQFANTEIFRYVLQLVLQGIFLFPSQLFYHCSWKSFSNKMIFILLGRLTWKKPSFFLQKMFRWLPLTSSIPSLFCIDCVMRAAAPQQLCVVAALISA